MKVYCILLRHRNPPPPPAMPTVTFHKNGQTYRDEVAPRTNLGVRAGSRGGFPGQL